MFVTVFYGILNVNTGEVTFCNAGHNPPYHMKPNGTVEPLPIMNDPMVGAIDGLDYHDGTLQLEHGDSFVLFTDGVTEAFNKDFEEFGDNRLKKTLEGVTRQSCQQTIETVKADVATFVGEAEQSDDITIMALKRL
jgi:sigma-B regulation protein RsbU (phosphoserine phosphatase)